MYVILACMSKTLLTDELTLQIRKLVVDGMPYVEIQSLLDISENTWESWQYRDTHGFRVNLNNWKNEFFIRQAEKVSREILALSPIKTIIRGKDVLVKIDNDLLRTKQKEAEFLRKTLAKNDGYASRTEHTGLDGKDLIAPSIIFKNYGEDETNTDTDDESGDSEESTESDGQ